MKKLNVRKFGKNDGESINEKQLSNELEAIKSTVQGLMHHLCHHHLFLFRRPKERDISEQIALGVQTGGSAGVQYDTRLFNMSAVRIDNFVALL